MRETGRAASLRTPDGALYAPCARARARGYVQLCLRACVLACSAVNTTYHITMQLIDLNRA